MNNNQTVGNPKAEQEEALRLMRIEAVERYKQELVDKIEADIQKLENGQYYENSRGVSIVRGIINCKSIIQSHAIKVN